MTEKKLLSESGNTYMVIGLRIAFYRKRSGMTQEKLADLCGISKSFLGKIEAPNINTSFSIAILEKIASVLGIQLKELFNPIDESLVELRYESLKSEDG